MMKTCLILLFNIIHDIMINIMNECMKSINYDGHMSDSEEQFSLDVCYLT